MVINKGVFIHKFHVLIKIKIDNEFCMVFNAVIQTRFMFVNFYVNFLNLT
jgi:hypothetical protein